MATSADGVTAFVERKLKLATALNDREFGGDYSDACMVLAALVGGVAADLWPGSGIDQRRFVEIWVLYAGEPGANKVSLPYLLRWLRKEECKEDNAASKKERKHQAEAIEGMRPSFLGHAGYGKIVAGEDVDADEREVLQACPTVALREIRSQTYAALFYRDVRSTLVHEYRHGGHSAQIPVTVRQVTAVSYYNLVDGPRLIHFHFPWLRDRMRTIVFRGCEAGGHLQRPQLWWLDGAPYR